MFGVNPLMNLKVKCLIHFAVQLKKKEMKSFSQAQMNHQQLKCILQQSQQVELLL